MAAFSSFSLSFLCLLCMQTPTLTTHHRGLECALWRAFKSQLRVCNRFHANTTYHFDTTRSRLFISLQNCGFFS